MADGTRILLFGGTFDPVHNGHLIIARAAAEQRGFGRVVLIPSASPPHKPSAEASADDRLAMCRLAVGDDPLFEICELELRRQGASYTVETLKAFRRQESEADLYWLIGADMLADLHQWYRAEEVVKLTRFIIVARQPWRDQLDPIFQALAEHFSPDVVETLRAGVTDTPLVDISSSDIRRRVAAGQPIDDLVPAAVADYIASHSLYR